MKISSDAKIALGGLAGGLVTGALFADEDKLKGAVVAGGVGLLGGASIGYSRSIAESYLSKTGFQAMPKTLMNDLAHEINHTYKPMYNQMTSESNKAAFHQMNAASEVLTSDTGIFNKIHAARMFSEGASQFDAKALQNISKPNLDINSPTDTLRTWYQHNKSIYDNANVFQKAAMASAFSVKTGADSINHHLIDPARALISKVKNQDFKGITKNEMGATAFNAFGVYEAGHILNDTANGRYDEAMGGVAALSAGKFAYTAGASALTARALMKQNNISFGDLVATGIAGKATLNHNLGITKTTG